MAQQETEQLNRILNGAALSRAVCTIAELGVADLVQSGKPQPIEHLAKASKTHEPSLYRILRFLASHGLFRETENRHFDHTPLSAALRTDAPGSFRAGAQMFHHLFAGWDGLHHSIQTGEPGFNKVFGAPIFNYIQAHPEMGPIFDAGMTSFNCHETTAMLDAYDFTGINVLADIGGGNGSLLSSVLARYPNMKGILFDLGHVVRGELVVADLPGEVHDRGRPQPAIEMIMKQHLGSGADLTETGLHPPILIAPLAGASLPSGTPTPRSSCWASQGVR